MLLFSENITPRLEYTARFLLRDCLGMDYRLTNDSREMMSHEGPGLNYSGLEMGHFPRVKPYGLLTEKGISDQRPVVEDWEGIPCFFRTSGREGLPFDIFSAAFWMLSRYEEYHATVSDQHGRFPAGASLAEKNGFLERPVVSLWAGRLKEALQRQFRGVEMHLPDFRFLSTIDIDIAWAYSYRPWWRVSGAFLSDLVSWQWKSFSERLLVLTGFREDPYDVYAYLETIHRRFRLKPLYFFLVGDYGIYGKNVGPRHPAMIRLVEKTMKHALIGLHPSYDSSEKPALLAAEKKRLEKITGSRVSDSRQHFLRLRLPDTCRELLKAGIERDYSLGFAGKPGFRAGTALPFRFYDLELEREETLTLFPLVLMDGSLREYMQLDVKEALSVSLRLLEEVKLAGGVFTTLWHNHSLSGNGIWKGWREVFEELLAHGSLPAYDKIS